MRRVFVDTGAFVALRNRAEREHIQAQQALRDLISSGATLFTSNFVVAETYTALLVRVGRDEAIAWGNAFRRGRGVELIRVDQRLEEEAWSILLSHKDKTWSYVDAVSFALMDRERVTEAFAFDRHFVQRGLSMLPGITL